MAKVSKEFVGQWFDTFATEIQLDSELAKSLREKIITDIYDYGFSQEEFEGQGQTFVRDAAFQIIKRFSPDE